MCRPLFPLKALAPALLWSRSYVHGSGALTTCGARWSGDGVAMAACDEPAASVSLCRSVSLRRPPVSLRRPPVSLRRPWSLHRPPTVTAESKPVVAVSTLTRLARRLAAGRPPWLRECCRTESLPRPASPRRSCRKNQAEPGTGTEAEWTTKEYLSREAETPTVWNLLAYTSAAAAAAVEARLS
jgi:hypothetical protein